MIHVAMINFFLGMLAGGTIVFLVFFIPKVKQARQQKLEAEFEAKSARMYMMQDIIDDIQYDRVATSSEAIEYLRKTRPKMIASLTDDDLEDLREIYRERDEALQEITNRNG